MTATTPEQQEQIDNAIFLTGEIESLSRQLEALIPPSQALPKHGGGFYGVPTVELNIKSAIGNLKTAMGQLEKIVN